MTLKMFTVIKTCVELSGLIIRYSLNILAEQASEKMSALQNVSIDAKLIGCSVEVVLFFFFFFVPRSGTAENQ